MQTPSFDKL